MSDRTGTMGFTLIELLIAMVLTSLVAILAHSGLQLGIQAWSASERHLQNTEERGLRWTLLRRLLEAPRQKILRDEEAVLQMAYRGTEQGLIFVAELPQLDERDELFWVQLVQVELEDNSPPAWQLLLRYHPFDAPTEVDWQQLEVDLADFGKQQVVIDALHEPLAFEYFGQLPDQEPTWQPAWHGQELLPLLVRVSSEENVDLPIRLSVTPRELAYGVKILD